MMNVMLTQDGVGGAGYTGVAAQPVARVMLSGTADVLTSASVQARVYVLTANSSITLPAEGAETWAFSIFNSGGAFTLSINRANATLLTALSQGDASTVIWDGTALGAY